MFAAVPYTESMYLSGVIQSLPTPFPASSFSTIVPTKQNQLKTMIFYFFPLASVLPFSNIDDDSRTSRK